MEGYCEKNRLIKESAYIKQVLKAHIKSLWVIMMTAPIPLITLLINEAASSSIFTVSSIINNLGYYNMFMGFVYAAFGGYMALCTDEFDFSVFGKTKVLLMRIISGLIFSMISFAAVLAVFSVTAVISGIGARLYFNFVLYAFIKFFTQIFLMFSIGFALGRIIKSRFVYIAAVAAAFLFTPVFDVAFNSDIETSFIRNFFNLTLSNPNYTQFGACGKIDVFFIQKSLFWIAAAVLIIILCLLMSDRKNIKPFMAAAPAITVVMTVLFYFCALSYPKMLLFNSDGRDYYQTTLEHEEKVNLYENDGAALDYYISKIDMDLHLGNKIKNECRITVHKTENTKFIKLRLDEAFNAAAYYYGKNSTPDGCMIYNRDGDYLYLEIPEFTYKDETIEFTIKYDGYLNYQNAMYSKVFYSTNESSCLYQYFSWYPQIVENNNYIDFNVTVHANNKFVSNITDGRLISDPVYTAGARLKQLYIFSGYFTEVKAGKYNCIIFEGYKNSKKAIAENVEIVIDQIKYTQNKRSNSLKYILNHFSGGNYSQPADASKIKTIIYCPFYFHGFTLFDQYDSAFFVCESI